MTKHQAPVVQPSTAKRPSTALCLLAVLIGMGLLQTFARPARAGREKPGPTRGDLILTEEALPVEIAGWTRTKFTPAPPVNELPQGQYWWVHQWQYEKDGVTALVSFDQLGEDHWHELTYCYRILDWVIDERSIQTDESSAGKYVVAQMSKEDGQHGLLVFSVFFEDGKWDVPPDFELSVVNRFIHEQEKERDLIGSIAGRVQPPEIPNIAPARNETAIRRALQCQVFISSFNPDSPSQLDAAIQLHLESRRHFRTEWLETRNSQSDPLPTDG